MKLHLRSPLVRWLPPGTLAFTWGEHVFVDDPPPLAVLLHEATHVRQFRRWGIVGFFLRHVVWRLRYGYKASPIEAEARAFLRQFEEPGGPARATWYLREIEEVPSCGAPSRSASATSAPGSSSGRSSARSSSRA